MLLHAHCTPQQDLLHIVDCGISALTSFIYVVLLLYQRLHPRSSRYYRKIFLKFALISILFLKYHQKCFIFLLNSRKTPKISSWKEWLGFLENIENIEKNVFKETVSYSKFSTTSVELLMLGNFILKDFFLCWVIWCCWYYKQIECQWCQHSLTNSKTFAINWCRMWILVCDMCRLFFFGKLNFVIDNDIRFLLKSE